MADTGWLTPGSVVGEDTSNSNHVAWTSPSNAATSNNVYTTATVSQSGTQPSSTRLLKATDYGAAVPTGDTITQVEVEVECKSSGSGTVIDRIYMVIGGTTGTLQPGAKAYGPLDTSDTAEVSTYTVPSITSADVNHSGFGVAVQCRNTAGAARTVSIDVVRIRITHEPPPSTQAPRTFHQLMQRSAGVA